jgi:hypothetical protein
MYLDLITPQCRRVDMYTYKLGVIKADWRLIK